MTSLGEKKAKVDTIIMSFRFYMSSFLTTS
jgi:hypothetical protein